MANWCRVLADSVMEGGLGRLVKCQSRVPFGQMSLNPGPGEGARPRQEPSLTEPVAVLREFEAGMQRKTVRPQHLDLPRIGPQTVIDVHADRPLRIGVVHGDGRLCDL